MRGLACKIATYSQELDSPKSCRIRGPLVKGSVSGNRNTWSNFKGKDQNDTKVKSLIHYVSAIG